MKLVLGLLLLCFSLQAQPHHKSVLVTNWVDAPAYFRVVDGQVYNPQKSTLWNDIPELANPNLNQLVHYSYLRVERIGKTSILCSVLDNDNGRIHITDWRDGLYVKTILVYHHPKQESLATGQIIEHCNGMKVKNWVSPDGISYEAYDCGLPYTNKIQIVSLVKIPETNGANSKESH